MIVSLLTDYGDEDDQYEQANNDLMRWARPPVPAVALTTGQVAMTE